MAAFMESLRSVAARALSWWAGELLDLVPARRPQIKASATVLVDDAGTLSVIAGPRRVCRMNADAGAIEALMMLARMRRNATVSLLLPQTSSLERRVELPKAARRQAAAILDLDLERSTPFKRAGVLSAFTLEPSLRKGWLTAAQVIVKRKSAEGAQRQIEALGLKVAHIGLWAGEGKPPLQLDLSAGVADRPAVKARSMAAPALLAAALAASLIWIATSRREAAIIHLDGEIAELRQKASDAHKLAAAGSEAARQANAVRSFVDARKPAAEIIDDLTRLLGDDVWLETLKLDGGAVEITGLAKSASAIVPVLERSATFKDAEPLAPITFDGSAGKEHFSYRVKLRQDITAAAADLAPAGETSPRDEVAVP